MQPWGLSLLPKVVDRLSAIISLGGISLGLLLISLIVAAFMIRRSNYALWWSTFLAMGVWIGYHFSAIERGLMNIREYLFALPFGLLLILLAVAYPRCWRVTLKGVFLWIAILGCGLGYLNQREREIAQKRAQYLHQLALKEWAREHRWEAIMDMRGFVHTINVWAGDPIDFNDVLKFENIDQLMIKPGIVNPEALQNIDQLKWLTGMRLWNTKITNDFIDGFNKSKWLRGISLYSCQVECVDFHRLDASRRPNGRFSITLFDTPVTREQIEELLTLADRGSLGYLKVVRSGFTEEDVIKLSHCESILSLGVEKGLVSPEVHQEILARRPRFRITEYRPDSKADVH